MKPKTGRDRLIVALDVPSHDQALHLVKALANVSFFKIGLELIVAGNYLKLLEEIQKTRGGGGRVFIDLKTSGDIGRTIGQVAKTLIEFNVKFITLSEPFAISMVAETIKTIREVRGDSDLLEILMVPMLSSLDDSDRAAHDLGDPRDTSTFIVERGRKWLDMGCDGLIVSGGAIGTCRRDLNCLIVSPGIRPAGFPAQDHKRVTTPAEAIQLGADYLVVGRPIITAEDSYQAAQEIIDEIDSSTLAAPSEM